MCKSIPALFISCVIGVGVAGGLSLKAADAPTTQPAKATNTKCVVSGEDIDATVTTVYKGQTYAFCCEDCVKKFNANPEKYLNSGK
jgi:YHS domain-containing protein